MATVRLNQIDREREHPQKSASGTAMLAAQLAALTTYQQIGDTYDIGNAPGIAGHIDWTDGSGTVLTVTALVSIDNSVWTRIPVFATPSSGASAVSPGTLTYAIAAWDDNAAPLGGSAGVDSCAFEFRFSNYRFVKLYAKSDSATGSFETTSRVWAGTLS